MTVVEEVKWDEIGPELVVHWYSPEVKVRGVMVVDTAAFGRATGGTRMLPDISTKEIVDLARGVTYKKATYGLPVGGAKAGIWAEPSVKGPRREAIFRAFGKALRPLYSAGIAQYMGDMGVTSQDIAVFGAEAGYPPLEKVVATSFKGEESVQDLSTGYGVVVAAKEACDFIGLDMSHATVAIEGFGMVSHGAARYFAESGAKVVAISTILGAIYNEEGLGVDKLLELRRGFGDELVLKYADARAISKEELFLLPVDVLVPGARPWVINEDNVDKVQARVISSGANIPITDGATEKLFRRGVVVVPDFVSNGGGFMAGWARMAGLDTDQIFDAIKGLIGKTTRDILNSSAKEGINPDSLATQRAIETVHKTKATKKVPTQDEQVQTFKGILEKTR